MHGARSAPPGARRRRGFRVRALAGFGALGPARQGPEAATGRRPPRSSGRRAEGGRHPPGWRRTVCTGPPSLHGRSAWQLVHVGARRHGCTGPSCARAGGGRAVCTGGVFCAWRVLLVDVHGRRARARRPVCTGAAEPRRGRFAAHARGGPKPVPVDLETSGLTLCPQRRMLVLLCVWVYGEEVRVLMDERRPASSGRSAARNELEKAYEEFLDHVETMGVSGGSVQRDWDTLCTGTEHFAREHGLNLATRAAA